MNAKENFNDPYFDIEAMKRDVESKFEREHLQNGRHRPGKVRNPMLHLTPKKKKRK